MESNELQRIKFLKQAPVVFTTDGKSFYVPVVNKSGEQARDSVTRPNDKIAYDAGDVVSTAAGQVLEFPNLGKEGNMITILSSRLLISVDTVPAGCNGFKLHLFNAPPTAIADNIAFVISADDMDKYLGYIDISTPVVVGDNIFSQDNDINFTAKLVGTSLYGILQTNAAYTPSENTVKTITLNVAGV